MVCMWFPWTPLVPTLIFVKTRRGLLVALVSPFSARGEMDASLASGTKIGDSVTSRSIRNVPYELPSLM